MKKITAIYFVCFTLSWLSTQVTALEIRIPKDHQRDSNKLPYKLLEAALARGGKYTATYPFGNIDSLPFSTRIQSVRSHESDIFSAISKPDYEKEFQAIYIPLYRGLMGMRLAIVKRSNKDLFKNVKDLNDLKQYTAGQGKLWTDSKILEVNNLPLVKELKYSNLFRMLESDRFDYFPRGAHEPWGEVTKNQDLDLVVDPHLMLWYDAPFYFFVHKSNTELAQHLTTQLNDMIADGEFLQLFTSDSEVQIALSKANLANRKVIKLTNPYLTTSTPTQRAELWHNPAERLENL